MTERLEARRNHKFAGILLAPFAPLLVGVITMRGGGIPFALWVLNVAAAAIGLAVAVLAWRLGARRRGGLLSWISLPIGVLLLAATLLGQGTDGVQRWLPIGPIQMHAGALLLPAMLVALLLSPWTTAAFGAVVVLVVLCLQPDAAQAGAFGAAWLGIVAIRREKWATTVGAVSALLSAACLLRPDPLEPVAHVEDIVGMAADQGLGLAVAAVISLAVLPLALAFLLERRIGLVLAIYTSGLLVSAWLGHHPVPVLGYGISPILGFYGALTMVALLGGLESESSRAANDGVTGQQY